VVPAELISRAVPVSANARAKAPHLAGQLVPVEAIEILVKIHNQRI